MRKLSSHFSGWLEALPDAIVLVDPDGCILVANSQAEILFGYGRGELSDTNFEVLLPERFRNGHAEQRRRCYDRPQNRPLLSSYELSGLRKDGSEFPVEICLSPLVADEGTWVMNAVRDISERKRFEQALQEKNEQLAAANQELETFSFSISHDLRAPLRHINGYAELLKLALGKDLAEKPGHYLDEIAGAAGQMVQLVDDLLDYSRLGRVEMQHAVLDLNMLAQTALSRLESETQDRNIVWKTNPLPNLRADPAMMLQVFLNLLSNAVKYTRPRDPAEIEIGCTPGEKEVVIFVRDNGVGFDMDFVGKLFGVFQRLHLREEFEGTGIGLANVRRIISRHGGRTWAEGEIGKGATFYFSLPTSGDASHS